MSFLIMSFFEEAILNFFFDKHLNRLLIGMAAA